MFMIIVLIRIGITELEMGITDYSYVIHTWNRTTVLLCILYTLDFYLKTTIDKTIK